MILALFACTSAPVDSDGKVRPHSIEDSGVDSGDSETAETASPTERDLYVYTQERYQADDSCLGAPTSTINETCLGAQTVSGTVVDLGGGGSVKSPILEFWTDDSLSGSADAYVYGSPDGTYSTMLPVCQELATRVGGDDVVPTIFQHRAFAWASDGGTTSEDYAINPDTLELAASFLGITPTAGRGSILGFLLDCSGASIVNAQVFLHDADDHAPGGMTLGYFQGGFPDPEAEASSSDGAVAIFNVPPGDYVAETWGWDGAAYVMLSSAPILIQADAVTIAYLVIGNEDGAAIPDICYADCSNID